MDKLNHVIQQNDTLTKKFEKQEKINQELKNEILDLKTKYLDMQKELISLNINKRDTEQAKLEKNIVISGIPKLGENVSENKQIVNDIAKVLKVNMEAEEFKCAIIGHQQNKQLKVIFKKKETKDLLMTAKKNFALNATQVGFTENQTLYLNHDLTKENQIIFKLAREMKKEKKIKYVWFADNKLYARKSDNSKIWAINTEEDLKVFHANPKN